MKVGLGTNWDAFTMAGLGRSSSFCEKCSQSIHSVIRNKPGTAQIGAISKAQKDSKTTFSTTGDNKSSQKTKN